MIYNIARAAVTEWEKTEYGGRVVDVGKLNVQKNSSVVAANTFAASTV